MADQTEFEARRAHDATREVLKAGIESGAFMALPSGFNIASLEEYQDRPNRVNAFPQFRDTRSLAAYLNRFETPQRIIFSSPSSASIHARIDYHQSPSIASHCEHSAAFKAQFDSHYKVWRENDGKSMTQKQVGEFLEENAIDITSPDSASVMEIVMNFEAIRSVTFKQSQRLNSGVRQFTYVEEDQVKGAITMPEMISITLPVFEGQEPDTVPVRVKYRLDDGKLSFRFEIHNRTDVERLAFERCENSLSEALATKSEILRVL